MRDIRFQKLAKILVGYSLKVKKEEKVLIECSDAVGLPLAKEVYKEILLREAYPFLFLAVEELNYFFYQNASPKQLHQKPEIMAYIIKWMDKSVKIRATKNERELSNVPSLKLLERQKTLKPLIDESLKKPWVLTYFPSFSLAQTAAMSLEEFEDIYFSACFQNWQKIRQKLEKIKKIMDNAHKVQIVGKQTDLTFSLKGRLAKVCAGEYNMPDGEIYAAPLEKTLEGKIYFEFPSLRDGKIVREIQLFFKNGRVVKAKAAENEAYLKYVLRVDKGASYVGEFAFGANYGFKTITGNTLFDEKIGGTIHLALGRAYKEKEGGGRNYSLIHWDLIKDMRPKGSKVIIDNKLVLENGRLIIT